jgi:hypothetical protein
MYHVIITDRAEENYLSIRNYILTYFSFDIVTKFDNAIDVAINAIKIYPESFGLINTISLR